MPELTSVRDKGKLYLPLVRKAEKLIHRMTAKWGVSVKVFYCQNSLDSLNLYGINTNELLYNNVPDLETILCFPAMWENYGIEDFNVHSTSPQELEDSIYTLPDLKIPLLAKVVVVEENTNRVYIIRKVILEHFNLAELFLQYVVDIMPSDESLGQVEAINAEIEDLSIFNDTQSNTPATLPQGVTISKIGAA